MTSLIAILTIGFCAGAAYSAPARLFARSPVFNLMSLGQNTVDQLAGRTNGQGYAYIYKDALHQKSVEFVNPTPAVGFYLADCTNIYGFSQGNLADSKFNVGACLSPISPRHCIYTVHVGWRSTNVWINRDGTFHTNTVLAGQTVGNDIGVCLMANTNQSWFKVLPPISGKISNNLAAAPSPLAIRFHDASKGGDITTFASAFNGSYFGGTRQFSFGDYGSGDNSIIGDSSSPALMVINNEAVLIGQMYSALYAPPVGLYTNQVNAAMAALSASNSAPAYQVELYDLTQFRNF